ncbi:MAG TPA: hypothetical protein VGM27_00615 [Acidobacteriaceae bacterium]
MTRRWFRLVLAIVTLVSALEPLVEIFDWWDKTPGPWDDSELRITLLFIGIGIALSLALLQRLATEACFRLGLFGFLPFQRRSGLCSAALKPVACTCSPPLSPLRI